MPDEFLLSGAYVYNIQIRIILGEIIVKHHVCSEVEQL